MIIYKAEYNNGKIIRIYIGKTISDFNIRIYHHKYNAFKKLDKKVNKNGRRKT